MTEPTPQYQTRPNQRPQTNGHWLRDTVAALTGAGLRCLPAGQGRSGQLHPFVPWKKDDKHYGPRHPKWGDPAVTMVAVQPPYDVVFLDADCYKDGAATWEDLEVYADYSLQSALFQKSLDKASFHFVYRVPADHNIKNCADGIPQLPHLDVRTTDGLIYVKPSKQLFCRLLEDVPDMPAALLALMPRNDNDRAYRQANAQPMNYTGTGLCDYLQSRGYEYRGENGGAQTFDHPNSHSQSAGVRVMLVDGKEQVWSFQGDALNDDHWHDLASAIAKLEPCDNGHAYKALQRAKGDWRRAVDLIPEIAREIRERHQAKEPPADHPAFSAPHSVEEEPEKPHRTFKPYTIPLDFDISKIPPRPWLIKGHLIRGFVNALIAPGAVGKSTYTLLEAISVATGRALIHEKIAEQTNVLLINNEDPDDEIQRRVGAIMQHYKLKNADLHGRLFLQSGYGCPFLVATETDFGDGPVIMMAPDAKLMIEYMMDYKIGLLTMDPFISTHHSNENDNVSIDSVIQQYRTVADKTVAAIRLAHHIKKMGGDSEEHAGNDESSRGASAMMHAARTSHTLARMSESTALKWSISPDDRRRLIRVDSAKGNFVLPDEEAKWIYMDSVILPSGESIGVPTQRKIEDFGEEPTEGGNGYGQPMQDVAHCILQQFGDEISPVRWTEIRGLYMEFTGYSRAAADEKITQLPVSRERAPIFHIGKSLEAWRIWQYKGRQKTAPRYVHLQRVN